MGSVPEREAGALPDFIIIGAQKSATTSLYDNFARHSRVFMARHPDRAREMHFFNNDQTWSRGVDWYRRRFERPELTQGEKTPSYFARAVAVERMAAVVPNARLVLFLRNPVFRAYSQWNHYRQAPPASAAAGWASVSFERAVAEAASKADSPFAPLLRTGRYADHLETVLRHFRRDQLHIGVTERLKARPVPEFNRVLSFLGLEPEHDDFAYTHMRKYPQPMSPLTATRLMQYFAPHNERLYELLGEEIPEWYGMPP
ncbi:MAG: sulfotransferase domain-containing protein [Pseudomonadota bacterium]